MEWDSYLSQEYESERELMSRLEFELANFKAAVQHLTYYSMLTPFLTEKVCRYYSINKKYIKEVRKRKKNVVYLRFRDSKVVIVMLVLHFMSGNMHPIVQGTEADDVTVH